MKTNLEALWSSTSKSISQVQPTELDSELMARLTGGGNSAGNYCSVSAECNSDGHSCGKLGNVRWEDIQDYLNLCEDSYLKLHGYK